MTANVKSNVRPSRNDNHNFNDDFTPREYQTSLYEKAKEYNTIICLGTGTGKTFIAMMVINEKSGPLRVDYDTEMGKRTVITVPSKQAAQQHADTVKNHTDLTVKVFNEEDFVDEWTDEHWHREIRFHQVLIMPGEILRLIVLKNILPVCKINLVVFDECHRVESDRERHPYSRVMEEVKLLPSQSRPHILGLTPSLISKRCRPNEIRRKIEYLENIMLSKVETSCDIKTLNKYGATPEVEVATFNPIVELSLEDLNAINGHQYALCEFIKSLKLIDARIVKGNIFDKIIHAVTSIAQTAVTCGIWSAFKLCKIYSDDIGSLIEGNQVNRLQGTIMSAFKNQIDLGVIVYGRRLRCIDKEYDRLVQFASPKMLVLLDKLAEYSPTNESSKTKKPLCGIVFVKDKKDVFLLTYWLQEISRTKNCVFGFLKVDYVVGENCSDNKVNRIHQEKTLTKFRKHELNLLISTSALEEGLDVPRCNLVIRYHFPATIRQFIQSKGRARSEGSRFIVLVCNSDSKSYNDKLTLALSDFAKLEDLLSQKDSKNVADDCDNECEVELADKLKQLYSYTTSTGVQLSLNSAIPIINKYCMKLPSDSFTKLVPISIVKRDGDKSYSCQLRLPINCPLRAMIESDSCPSARVARKVAAFKAARQLHHIKELDDNLLPVGKENLKYLCEDLDFEPYGDEFECIGKDSKDQPRPGTTKRRQYYTKLTADVLKGSPPTAHVKCYMYIFAMRLSKQIPDEQNTRRRRISDPAETSRSFGIIIPHKVPEICDFPVFTRSGEVTVSLQEASCDLLLTNDQIDKISSFHDYIFHSVLKVDPFPIKFDIKRANTNYYLVPVSWNAKWILERGEWICEENVAPPHIDWDIMERVEEYKEKGDYSPGGEERGNFVFNRQHFEDAVVKRWYFKSREEYFYVAEICENENPLSPFPDDQYQNYVQYYEDKYNISLKNMSQPLLDVDHTSARLNLLTPRYVNRKGVSLSTTKKEKKENVPQKLHLIPELCCIHPFPASFWRKAVTLPCILYRMNVLLNAEQLRAQIAKDISIGPVIVAKGQKWPPLDFGWPLLADANDANDTKPSTPEVRRKKCNFKHKSNKNASGNNNKFIINDTSSVPRGGNNDDDAFVIDTFDPAKHIVPDMQFGEELLFNSVDDMLLGRQSGAVFTLPTFITPSNWQRDGARDNSSKIIELHEDNGDYGVDERTMRGGSPSLLENDAWDEDTDCFISVGLPVGLERISVTHEFNAETLRRDLAAQRDFDFDYDSDDSIDDDLDDDDDAVAAAGDDDDEMATAPDSPSPQSPERVTSPPPLRGSAVVNATSHFKLLHDEKSKKNIADDEDDEFNCDLEIEDKIKAKFTKLIDEVTALQVNLPCDIECKLVEKNETGRETGQCDATNGGKTPENNETNFGELLPKAKRIQLDTSIECRLKFDAYKCDMKSVVGPSPNEILQALTMSNASDGINLERLETVGDSFLKYAVTLFLYCKCPNIHEGKLSYLRSRQISNFNLYRQGQRKGLGQYIIATKFEPNDNWLPPGYYIPKGLDEALVELGADAAVDLTKLQSLDIHSKAQDELKAEILAIKDQLVLQTNCNAPLTFKDVDKEKCAQQRSHYSLISQQSIPDKSIADCVEALIGAYLLHAGPRGALYFMRWLKLKVMHDEQQEDAWNTDESDPIWHHMPPVSSPVNVYMQSETMKPLKDKQLCALYHDAGLVNFENNILNYTFKDKAYLIQAFTHNSYFENQLTDCYQRLEFLGDAILDYLVTRMLYEDQRKHSPGILTDLRSALVNNTFFASLAVEYQFHKYLKNTSHDLYKVMNDFVNSSLAKEVSSSGSTGLRGLYRANASTIAHCESETLLGDVEVPKALGDIFESVAGAIFLDSGMSLDAVWRVYYPMMKPEIEHFSENVPKSPIRELLELEPQNAQFGKPELVPGKRVRVTVEIFGEQKFSGVGRNKRIAKCTAAKQALKYIKGQKDCK